MTAPLRLKNVTKQFGNLTVVNGVSLEIHRDETTAIIGPNGAGKTTTYNLISGALPLTNGDIYLHDQSITGKSPAERTMLGLGRSYQITNIFDDLTIRQNMRAPVLARMGKRWNPLKRVESFSEVNEETDRLLSLLELNEIESAQCNVLSYGDKRTVELGVALATDPSVLLLDEPTAGMNPTETNRMVDLIDNLQRQTETTFIITEHDMDVVFNVASRIVVLNRGSIIADGDPDEIRKSNTVQEAYLGGEV